MPGYEEKKQRLIAQMLSESGDLRLQKQTSNLFRDRKSAAQTHLNVSDFNQVIEVNPDDGWVEAEGMSTYQDLVDATLPYNTMPSVVPQLKSITVGGAIAGVGIESTSFKHGLVHENILEMEVLTSDGRIVLCAPSNQHQDLFYGIPNSYGTLGYILKIKVRTIPIRRFVKLQHTLFKDPSDYFTHLERWTQKDIDFLDGTIFSPTDLYLTTGKFTDEAPYTSDYTFEHIYYRSIKARAVDYLTTHDYIWRWDTDWFWCSKNLFAQNPLMRRLYGRHRLNSVFYTKIMRWNAKWGLTRFFDRLFRIHNETVIQDVDIPIQRATEFLNFFDREIGIRPIWICPFRTLHTNQQFPLYPTKPQTLYINFGFWDVVRGKVKRPKGHYNKILEDKVEELGGIKSLYSDSYYDSDKFWALYSKEYYDNIKAKYDSNGRFKDLYQKCVLRQ